MSIKIVLSSKNAKTSCSDVCRVTNKELFNEEYVKSLTGKFSTVSNPIRLKMLLLLQKYGELTTCEFEKALELPQSKVSYHLKILVDSGILMREPYRQWSFYKLKDDSFFQKALKHCELPRRITHNV
jgi:ArsR family transcriptional regulator